MKKIFIAIILFGIGKVNAQNYNSDGVYSTTFGNVTLTTEYGSEFPGGFGITYGDYKDKGTITGVIGGSPDREEFTGTFFNGADEGKFIFFPKNKGMFENSFSTEMIGFTGYWGYNSDNKYSTKPADKWDGTRTQKTVQAIKNVTNVWSGKWNTSDGAMYLNQVANRIVGTYKGVGTIKAKYDPSTRLLKGTFTNNNYNKTGYIEFYFEGNTFTGKWGWTEAMTEGNWDGTKDVKNNKELSKALDTYASQTTTSTSQTNTSANQPNTNKDEDNSVKSIKQGLRSSIKVSNNKTIKISLLKIVRGNNMTTRLEELYGFAGVQVFKVTNSGSQLINSFGDKDQYFFNTTENNAFQGNLFGIHTFSNQPNYVREFQISEADWNNPNVHFEIRLWHHIKGKIYGPNRDYTKYSETYNLNTIGVDKNNKIWVGKDYKNGENTDSVLDLDFKNSRALFKIEIY